MINNDSKKKKQIELLNWLVSKLDTLGEKLEEVMRYPVGICDERQELFDEWILEIRRFAKDNSSYLPSSLCDLIKEIPPLIKYDIDCLVIGAIEKYMILLDEEIKQSYATLKSLQQVKVDLDKKEILIGDKTLSMAGRKGTKQGFLLIEDLLQNKTLHWTSGFIHFKNWQKKVPSQGPIAQFWSLISRFNNELGMDLIIDSKRSKGCWELNSSIEVISTLDNARNYLKKALQIQDVDEKINFLKQSLNVYPGSAKACKVFIETIQKISYDIEKVKNEFISALEILRRRERDLNNAVCIIQSEISKENHRIYWDEAWQYLLTMAMELKEIRKYKLLADRIWKGVQVNNDEVKCLSIIQLIDEIKDSKIASHSRNAKSVSLVQDPFIKECLKSVTNIVTSQASNKGLRNIKRSDIESTALSSFWELINEKAIDFRSSSELKSYFINSLVRIVFNDLRKLQGSDNSISIDEEWKYRDANEKFDAEID